MHNINSHMIVWNCCHWSIVHSTLPTHYNSRMQQFLESHSPQNSHFDQPISQYGCNSTYEGAIHQIKLWNKLINCSGHFHIDRLLSTFLSHTRCKNDNTLLIKWMELIFPSFQQFKIVILPAVHSICIDELDSRRV